MRPLKSTLKKTLQCNFLNLLNDKHFFYKIYYRWSPQKWHSWKDFFLIFKPLKPFKFRFEIMQKFLNSSIKQNKLKKIKLKPPIACSPSTLSHVASFSVPFCPCTKKCFSSNFMMQETIFSSLFFLHHIAATYFSLQTFSSSLIYVNSLWCTHKRGPKKGWIRCTKVLLAWRNISSCCVCNLISIKNASRSDKKMPKLFTCDKGQRALAGKCLWVSKFYLTI